jgi:orotate phosphoribosyltransferase
MTAVPETDFFPKYEAAGIVRPGHFEFASGRHATEKADFDGLYGDERLTAEVGGAMGRLVIADVGLKPIFLIGVDSGGNKLLGPVADEYETITGIRPPTIITARTDEQPREFYIPEISRRGLPYARTGWKAVIIEDVINRYTNSGQVVDLVAREGYEVALIAAALRRGPASVSPQGVPGRAIAEHLMDDWEAADCAPCAAGEPLTA